MTVASILSTIRLISKVNLNLKFVSMEGVDFTSSELVKKAKEKLVLNAPWLM